jgi:peptide/nickel transport system substrate-binding protein
LSERRFKTDLDLARQHLEAAGYGDGLAITLQYHAAYPQDESIGILYKENLAKIGVTLDLQKLPAGQHSTGKYEQSLPFFIEHARPWIATPEYMFRLSFQSDSPSNFTSYQNDVVDELTPLAVEEFDADVRKELNAEIQEEILEDFVWLYVCQPDFEIAMSNKIIGYVAQNTGFHHWWMVDKLP